MNITKYKSELTDTLVPAFMPESTYKYASITLESAEAVVENWKNVIGLNI